METYAIKVKANGFVASTIESNLSYEKSKQKLLDMYNEYYENERGYSATLDNAYKNSEDHIEGMDCDLDGFTYDSRRFYIEIED